MSNLQILLIILIFGFGVWLPRFLPFLLFKDTANLPKIIGYLGNVLPAAMMGLLVVYCLKDTSFGTAADVLPLLISVAAVIAIHLLRRNTVLSIFAGTVLYMILLRVF